MSPNSNFTVEAEKLFKKNYIPLVQEMVYQSPRAIWVFQKNPFKLVYINKTVERIWDITTEEIYNDYNSLFKKVHPDDLGKVKNYFQLLQKGIKPKQNPIQFRLIHCKGCIKQIEQHINNISTDSGDFFVIHNLDVTDLRYIEQHDYTEYLLLKNIVSDAPVIMFLKDVEGRYIFINRDYLHCMKIKRSDILGKKDSEVFSDEMVKSFKQVDDLVLQGQTVEKEIHMNGLHLHIQKFLIKPDNEHIDDKYICGICTDITEQKRSEKKLKENEKFLNQMMHLLPHIVYIFNLKSGNITYANKVLERIKGSKGKELHKAKLDIQKILHPDDFKNAAKIEQKILSLKDKESLEHELRILDKDNNYIWITNKLSIFSRDSQGNPIEIIGTVQDIDYKKKLEEKLHIQAYYDELTGLYNRNKFINELQNQVDNKSESFSLLFIDLNKFKSINDTYGHDIGDFVLLETAKRLKNIFLKDHIIARLGGDEFTVIIRNCKSKNDLEQYIKKILVSLEKPYIYDSFSFTVNASIGGVISPNKIVDSAKDMLRLADIAMYQSKRSLNESFTLYTDKMLEKVIKENTFEIDLKRAVLNSEMTYFYQSIYDVHLNKEIGAEILSRWNHPDDGFLLPQNFIPIAEKCNFIDELDLKTATNSIKYLQNIQIKKPNFIMSINVSAKSIALKEFVDQLIKLTKLHSINKYTLTIELTETQLITNLEETLNNIKAINDAHINLAIDDFGTGYSSLNLLNKLPAKYLKIDKSFIQNINTENGRVIVKTILNMAHNLNIMAVAEGVETKEQKEILQNLGCNLIQGYIINRPNPVENLL